MSTLLESGNFKANFELLHGAQQQVRLPDTTESLPSIEEVIENKRVSLKLGSSLPEIIEDFDQSDGFQPQKHTRLLVIFGFGLGAQFFRNYEKLISKPQMEILIIEKRPEVFARALQLLDLSDLKDQPQIHFWVGQTQEQLNDLFRNFFFSKSRAAYLNAIQVLGHPELSSLDESYYRVAEALANKWIHEAGMMYGNSCEDAFLGFQNSLRNTSAMMSGFQLKEAASASCPIPAIIVSSGPSLENSLKELQELQDSCFLIAADSSLRLLAEHAITPHFVTAIERSPLVEEFFENLEASKNSILACLPLISPQAVTNFLGPKVFFFRDFPFFEVFGVSSKQQHRVGPSCAHLSFLVAKLLGCKKIYLVGQDLAYSPTDYRSHSKGLGIKGRDESHKAEELLSDDSFFEVDSVQQKPVITSKILNSFRLWFEEEFFANPQIQVFNCSPFGAKIAHTFGGDLKTLCLEQSSKNQDLHAYIQENMLGFETLDESIKQNFLKASESLATFRKTAEELKQKAPIHQIDQQIIHWVNHDLNFQKLLVSILTPYLYRKDVEKNLKQKEIQSSLELNNYLNEYYQELLEQVIHWASNLESEFSSQAKQLFSK